MNDMELLRELAQATPLPAPAELDAARARLVAGIATDPATYAKAVAEVTAGQPRPSSGQPAERLRPPAPVLSAGKFMHAGAVSSAAYLIVALPFMGDSKGRVLGHPLTAAPLTITLVVVVGLAVIALWLWMARATSQGRNWARILSTVLFGLATLELIGNHGVAQVFCAVLTWLTGLAAVWLLWRPASSAFFRRCRQAALTRQP
ncbi:MAG: hypothetical protein ACLP8X_43925 [Streptosporangiaceae bacterium]